jgi:hypothetical protein
MLIGVDSHAEYSGAVLLLLTFEPPPSNQLIDQLVDHSLFAIATHRFLSV